MVALVPRVLGVAWFLPQHWRGLGRALCSRGVTCGASEGQPVLGAAPMRATAQQAFVSSQEEGALVGLALF